MADDLKNRGAQDRARISMSEEHEVRYWTKSTSRVVVSLQTLSKACWRSQKIARKPLPNSSRA